MTLLLLLLLQQAATPLQMVLACEVAWELWKLGVAPVQLLLLLLLYTRAYADHVAADGCLHHSQRLLLLLPGRCPHRTPGRW